MINKSIGVEGMTLILSLFWGMVLAFEYDCIRVFRRIVKHKRVWTISVEDIIYWINVAITAFSIIYELNNGIIRGFVTGGFIAGAFIYRYSVGKLFVKYTTFILQRSAIMGLVLAFLLVIVIGVVMYINKASLQKQYDINEQTKADLQAQLEEQQQRTKDLEEYKKYIQTKKFVEEMAKDKFGLIYPDELVFRPENK